MCNVPWERAYSEGVVPLPRSRLMERVYRKYPTCKTMSAKRYTVFMVNNWQEIREKLEKMRPKNKVIPPAPELAAKNADDFVFPGETTLQGEYTLPTPPENLLRGPENDKNLSHEF